MEAATVRAIHNAAQEETRALRAIEPGGDEANDAAALALVLSLAGRVRALQAATVALATPSVSAVATAASQLAIRCDHCHPKC